MIDFSTLHESPFVDSLGVQLVTAEDGASEVVLPLTGTHMNTWGIAHGGVTMALADVALAMAVRSLADDGIGVVTIEMKVNFMQPGRGELRAFARVLHRSTTMAYCEGEIRDSEGHFVAKALGTFKYMRKLAVGSSIAQQRLRSDPSATPTRSPQRRLTPLPQGAPRALAYPGTAQEYHDVRTPFNQSPDPPRFAPARRG